MVNFRRIRIADFNNTNSIELNDFDGYIVTAPSGFGVYMENQFLNVGSKRIKTSQKNAYQNINLTVDIYAKTREEVEQKYIALRNFLVKYREKGFRVYYTAYEGEERYVLCDIKTLDKTEKLRARYMSLPLLLEIRSFWKTDIQSSSTVADDTDINSFTFEQDEDYDTTGTRYDIAQSINTSGDLSATGYDFSKFPEQIKIYVSINNGQYVVDFSNQDFIQQSETLFVSEKTYRRVAHISIQNGTRYDLYQIKCEIDLENRRIRVSSIKKLSALVNVSGTESFSADAVTFERTDNRGGECNLTFLAKPLDSLARKGVGNYIGSLPMADGQTVATKVIPPYKITVQQGGQSVEETGAFIIKEVNVYGLRATKYTESSEQNVVVVNGAIYDGGIDNYVVGLKYDENVLEYNASFYYGSAMNNTVKNDGDNEVPLIIRLYGACINPTITLSDINGNVLQTSKITSNIPSGAYIEINSDAEDTGVWLVYQSTGVRINMVQYVDETTNMFITLPKGEYNISVTDQDNNSVPTTVFFANEYIGA